jgi:hypothetical protein
VCRDIAITYASIFTKLGFVNDYIFTDNHVYNNIYKRNMDCTINMDEWFCW